MRERGKFPLWLFAGIQKLSLKGTPISSRNFPKLTTVAKQLRALDISNCDNITEEAIFGAKYNLQTLRSVNISYNPQFTVLTITCLLSYESIVDVFCWGKILEDKEMLFLFKTFSQLTNAGIDLRLDGVDEDYFLDLASTASGKEDQ